MSQALFDKLWQRHVVAPADADGPALLYVDRHLVYEVTSPQAFEGLRLAGRKPWRRETVLATADHNVPTTARDAGIRDPFRASKSTSLLSTVQSLESQPSAWATDAKGSST